MNNKLLAVIFYFLGTLCLCSAAISDAIIKNGYNIFMGNVPEKDFGKVLYFQGVYPYSYFSIILCILGCVMFLGGAIIFLHDYIQNKKNN